MLCTLGIKASHFKFYIETYQYVLLMVFAIEEINHNLYILPNITVGFKIYDICYAVARGVGNALRLLSGKENPVPNFDCKPRQKFSGIVGDSATSTSLAIAKILGLYKYPQISYGAPLNILSDKHQFPSFFRTIPNDDYQCKGLAHTVIHFRWTWVGLLASDEDYGVMGGQKLKEEITNGGVCIAFFETIYIQNPTAKVPIIVDLIHKTSVNVILIYAAMQQVVPLMEEFYTFNITAKVWLASSGWSISPVFSKNVMLKLLNGTLGFSLHRGDIPGYKDFLYNIHPTKFTDDIFIRDFWECEFSCLWPRNLTSESLDHMQMNEELHLCTGREKLDELGRPAYDEEEFRFTYSAYNAVYALAHALHDLYTCTPTRGPFKNDSCSGIHTFQPWQTPSSVCSESCLPGHRKAARPGHSICCFDCILCSEGHIANLTDTIHCKKCQEDQWSNERRDACIPKLVEFLSFDDILGCTLTTGSLFFSLLTATVLCIFIKHRTTPLVKANNRELSYLLLLSLILCFLCCLMFIGYPKKINCMFRQMTFGIIFSICISSILAKTVTVVIAFNATKPNRKFNKCVGSKIPNCIVICCVGLQLIVCVVWLSLSPPFNQQNMETAKDKIIIECNEGYLSAFYCMLGYLGILAIISFIVAFLARNLPDSFNEAKFITFSMIVFTSVWLSFIPAYISTRGKYMVAVEVFAIMSSSAGLLICIFFPKCFIILLQPSRNTRQHLTGKPNYASG
ncbi:vomeronasal type-2 receptor 26-like [Protopterus annectens]|uniref:vomeronasal type-2 receptor 26-like n=1 Tax=Protopterus annectens TaxID=7888 RepID=UPI001CFA090C|nr:vomeronasal type-2 receptor 26-like [Protopterus annectens]